MTRRKKNPSADSSAPDTVHAEDRPAGVEETADPTRAAGVTPVGADDAAAPPGAPDHFFATHELMRSTLEHAPEDAVVALAFHRWSHNRTVCILPALQERRWAVVVGRHPDADLVLSEDPTILPRHLLLLARLSPAGRVELRVIDLRSEHGFMDGAARTVRMIDVDGSTMFVFNDYALFLFDARRVRAWPSDPAAAWGVRPDQEEVTGDGPATLPGLHDGVTLLRELEVPDLAHAPRNFPVGPAVGRLELEHNGVRIAGSVDAETLRRGLLLGRDRRCDALDWLPEESGISDEHLLLLSIDDEVLAVDLASSGGTFDQANEPVRVLPVRDRTSLVLGDDAVRLCWTRLPGRLGGTDTPSPEDGAKRPAHSRGAATLAFPTFAAAAEVVRRRSRAAEALLATEDVAAPVTQAAVRQDPE